MGIERIINKIIEDAKLEADSIVKEAEAKRIEELENAKKEFLVQANQIISTAKKEAQTIRQRSESRILLEQRKEISMLKERIVTELIAEAIRKIKKEDSETLKKILKKMILSSEISGAVEVRASTDLKKIFNSKFIEELNSSLPESMLVMSTVEPEESDVELVLKNYSVKINIKDFFDSKRSEIAKEIFDFLEI
ncbi:MAG: V-type ATP synthase subunit E [Actinobacteria bacterium]|nr:V-type ATP synthase subunit E [Actinomycetota bacterium]